MALLSTLAAAEANVDWESMGHFKISKPAFL
jgi:hypothetical protein